MVTIYLLINPFTDLPFYVGATAGELRLRIKQHLTDFHSLTYGSGNPVKRRKQLLQTIADSDKSLKVQILGRCEEHYATEIERRTYMLFKLCGFEMLQNDYNFIRKPRY